MIPKFFFYIYGTVKSKEKKCIVCGQPCPLRNYFHNIYDSFCGEDHRMFFLMRRPIV